MRYASTMVAMAAVVFTSACGGDNGTGPTKPDNGSMTARIDGATWSAISIATTSGAGSSLIISGTNIAETLSIVIPLDQGTGTQTVSLASTVSGAFTIGSQSWVANPVQGGTGTITLTTVAPGHVTGTFEFALAALQGATPATRQVTSGQFDVKY